MKLTRDEKRIKAEDELADYLFGLQQKYDLPNYEMLNVINCVKKVDYPRRKH